MNIKILVILWCICLSQIISAQQKRFIGGLLLNINGIEFKGTESQYWNSSNSAISIEGTLGSSVGLFVKRDITKKIYSTLELRYIRKGSIYEFTSDYGTQAFETLLLRYIEIPILMGYNFKPIKRIFHLESGIAFAKMISSNIEKNDLTTRKGTPNAKEFNNTDFSWIASLKFPTVMKWKEHFLFGLRISRSILPIHKYYKIYNFDYGVELNYVFNK